MIVFDPLINPNETKKQLFQFWLVCVSDCSRPLVVAGAKLRESALLINKTTAIERVASRPSESSHWSIHTSTACTRDEFFRVLPS